MQFLCTFFLLLLFIYLFDETFEHGVVEKFVPMRRQCNSITHFFLLFLVNSVFISLNQIHLMIIGYYMTLSNVLPCLIHRLPNTHQGNCFRFFCFVSMFVSFFFSSIKCALQNKECKVN